VIRVIWVEQSAGWFRHGSFSAQMAGHNTSWQEQQQHMQEAVRVLKALSRMHIHQYRQQ
jgi:hypothetical protein